MGEPRVTEEDLGAWVLKGNADQADLPTRFAAEPRVETWCVQPGYRARLMAAGQPVVFWGSGSRRRLAYGVWGLGTLAGPAAPDERDGRWRVPLDLVISEPAHWISRDQLRADHRLAGIEVLRQPQAGNPSYLTRMEYAALADHALPDGERLERTILSLLAQRKPTATICPSDAARAIGGDTWRELMEPARAAARRLRSAGQVEITQHGEPVDPDTVKGPIRIRRAGQPGDSR